MVLNNCQLVCLGQRTSSGNIAQKPFHDVGSRYTIYMCKKAILCALSYVKEKIYF